MRYYTILHNMKALCLRFIPGFIRTRIESSSTLQNILANTGWLLFDKIFRMGGALFVGVWVARYLGPEHFGTLNYAYAFVALISELADLGMDGIMTRDIVRQPQYKDEILGTAFVLRFIAGFIAFMIAFGAIFIVRPDDKISILLVGILSARIIFRPFGVIGSWFQARVQSKYLVWVGNITFIIISFVRIGLILLLATVVSFAWVYLAETVLCAIGGIIAYQRTGNSIMQWKAKIGRAKILLRESWPLILSTLMIMLYMRIDQVMIGTMIGDEEVGIFSAAVRVSEVWYFIPIVIASSVFPSLVKSKQLGEKIYLQRIQKYYDLNALIAYSLSIPLFFLSPFIIKLLYGELYKGAGIILSIHIWASLFVFLGVARSQYLVNESMLAFSFFSSTMGAIINIGLNLFLIPKYQATGAAIATVISQFISAFLTSFLVAPLFNTGLMQIKAMLAPIRYFSSKCKWV